MAQAFKTIVYDLNGINVRINNYSDKIAAAYEDLGRRIYELNKERNDALIEEQKRYAENIASQTNMVIKVVADAVKRARNEYIQEVENLHKRIDDIKNNNIDDAQNAESK